MKIHKDYEMYNMEYLYMIIYIVEEVKGKETTRKWKFQKHF